ncbi:archaetidylserine decarboxylase [Thiohalophilus sp.]|uniref:archaetidylserine decarboxylase n=1 Tax=Thiohalophilus sp. TaxID=3028392 RepID=UPI002ACE5DF8|nr:archaetidylserine decarboxylase [Thiohalophilus sp.]MDZ7662415.1 archaetidylserine decarboxylase [Thiohalophilus sp.]
MTLNPVTLLRRVQAAAFVALQYALPHHLLSHLMGRLTRLRIGWLKDLCITSFIRLFNVNMAEAAQPDPRAYPDFNHFFTRALAADARPLAVGDGNVICPVDGTVSQLGRLQYETLLQAKGHRYVLSQLLADHSAAVRMFQDGHFATLYLSPRDYHRIHMPLAGTLREMIYVPGRLFSVNPTTVNRVPDLFARNERVICLFDTELGPMAMILVGAIFVASIDTVWHGTVTPPRGKTVQYRDYRQHPVHLQQGEEMGRFNMGSTVILLFGKDAVTFSDELAAEDHVQMGQLLGTRNNVEF